ncbi:DUF4429 domain-containing protein [Streptomyces oceani]|uniref:Tat pathway signal sequence domain protein n=1 Tax=Streptomyces oceani TaxID=1075402 RepID=A0A1E7KG01_9ACTN|nr:DUF4429 domain-containing protein [Streptomyces oceani]OEV02804.1 Tat pathway signal sequence domain protein [Streptomyces oceani]
MAEILQPTGSWTFDRETLRIVPGSGKGVHTLRKTLGEVAVPLEAVAGIAYEAGRKSGRLRLRLRTGADPLAQVANGRLPDSADPYQLTVESDRSGVAEYLVEEVRNALLLEQVPGTPCDRFLLPGPSIPLTAACSDGTATFDGERVHLEWNWMAEESKSYAGPRSLAIEELSGVEWTPSVGWENGNLRFRPKGPHATIKPEHDPNSLTLWGIRQARETSGAVLLAAAVTVRLPHPASADENAPAIAPSAAGAPQTADGAPSTATPNKDAPDHDGLLRRLRELGELHQSGVLTDDEFATAKKAILDRF